MMTLNKKTAQAQVNFAFAVGGGGVGDFRTKPYRSPRIYMIKFWATNMKQSLINYIVNSKKSLNWNKQFSTR